MISIVTPTFNSGKTILRNAQSVIDQSYQKFEHIIVDNASTDDTIEKVKAIYNENGLIDKLKVISEKDEGISDAFNKGILASKGEIIGILNSDDEYFNNSVFERVISSFKDENILIVHGDIYFADSVYGSNRRAPKRCPSTSAILFNHPTMFVRESIYEKLGLYNKSFYVAMDTEFFYRIKKSFGNVESISKYINEVPIAIMNAGGESWNREIDGINELKAVLKLHGYWNFAGKWFYSIRIIRTKIKKPLTLLNLNFIVKLWRKLKWG
ncbi:MAG: glycosyltransferase family 2 protein [Ignavibacteriaceae bacterium]